MRCKLGFIIFIHEEGLLFRRKNQQAPLRSLEPEYVTWNATILPLNRASALLRAQLALNTISQSRTDKIRLVNE